MPEPLKNYPNLARTLKKNSLKIPTSKPHQNSPDPCLDISTTREASLKFSLIPLRLYPVHRPILLIKISI